MANRLLHIGDLDDQVSVETLKSAFITFGDIVNISIPKAIAKFGLVEFQDPEDAWHAQKNMNGAELFGKPIRVTFAKGIGFDEATGKETNTSVWESS